MTNSLIQLLVLAAVAVFLILKLRSVLGTRDGFEKPPVPLEDVRARPRREADVAGADGPDRDITDHVTEGSSAAEALAAMKRAEPAFSVNTFLQGARGAYEMILMGFEHGDLDRIRPFLAADVAQSFAAAIEERENRGLSVEANFVGLKEMALHDATFDPATGVGEVTVRFVGELTSIVRDKVGEVVEGRASEVKRQRDVWTFARKMGAADPNWQLVATGD